MAAGGWFDWSTGDLVTEARFQDIQDSIAFIYASEAAANTALTNKVTGTQFYDTGAGKLKIWNGSAWVAVGGGITEADNWRLTTSVTTSIDGVTNWERPDGTLQPAYVGTGMTETSGVWTFPATGIYMVTFSALGLLQSINALIEIEIETTANNGGAYDKVAAAHLDDYGGTMEGTLMCQAFIDVQDTSNDKVRFNVAKADTITVQGDTTNSWTQVNFIRLGDT